MTKRKLIRGIRTSTAPDLDHLALLQVDGVAGDYVPEDPANEGSYSIGMTVFRNHPAARLPPSSYWSSQVGKKVLPNGVGESSQNVSEVAWPAR